MRKTTATMAYVTIAMIVLGSHAAIQIEQCGSATDCAAALAGSVVTALIWPVALTMMVPRPILQFALFVAASLVLAIIIVWASGKYLPRLLPPPSDPR